MCAINLVVLTLHHIAIRQLVQRVTSLGRGLRLLEADDSGDDDIIEPDNQFPPRTIEDFPGPGSDGGNGLERDGASET